MPGLRPTIAALALLAASLACSSDPGTAPPAAPGAEAPTQAAPGGAGVEIASAPEEHLSAVIAEVNGRPLYRAFYEQSLTYMRQKLPTTLEDEGVSMYIAAKFDALERLIDDELIYQRAQDSGVRASDEEVLAETARAAAQAGGITRWLAQMRTRGLSAYDAREGIRKRLTIDRYLTQGPWRELRVNDEEALTYYNENLTRFAPELWIKVHHIVIRCPRDSDAPAVAAARQRAEKILANVRAGEPFEKMAREFSEDSSAALGGSLGFVRRGALWPEFEAVAFAIAPRQVSEVIRTDVGFHILMVAERRGGEPKPFDQVKDECRKALLTARRAEVLQRIAAELRASAKIVSYLQ